MPDSRMSVPGTVLGGSSKSVGTIAGIGVDDGIGVHVAGGGVRVAIVIDVGVGSAGLVSIAVPPPTVVGSAAG